MRVRIYRPTKTAMQSRSGCDTRWRIEVVPETARHTNGLMGWTSADDTLSSLSGRLTFATQGEALTFARARGWEFRVETPNERKIVPKSYIDNFNPDRRRSGR